MRTKKTRHEKMMKNIFIKKELPNIKSTIMIKMSKLFINKIRSEWF